MVPRSSWRGQPLPLRFLRLLVSAVIAIAASTVASGLHQTSRVLATGSTATQLGFQIGLHPVTGSSSPPQYTWLPSQTDLDTLRPTWVRSPIYGSCASGPATGFTAASIPVKFLAVFNNSSCQSGQAPLGNSACQGDILGAPQGSTCYTLWDSYINKTYIPDLQKFLLNPQNVGVAAIEVWNEENLAGSLVPATSFAEMLALAATTIKALNAEYNRSILVVAGGLAAPDTASTDTYLDTVLKTVSSANPNALDDIDAFGIHPYFRDWTRVPAVVSNLENLISTDTQRSFPLWATEFGEDAGSGDSTAAQQATYLTHMVSELGASGVPVAIWYAGSDDVTSAGNSHWGLVTSSNGSSVTTNQPPLNAVDVVKPAGNAFSTLAGAANAASIQPIMTATPQATEACGGCNQLAPMSVQVLDSSGNPAPYALVTFSAPATGAGIDFGGAGCSAPCSSQQEATGLSGVATVPDAYENGQSGSFAVCASTPGLAQSCPFLLNNTVSPPDGIATAPQTSPQITAAGTVFPQVLSAAVTNSAGSPVAGVPVTFNVLTGLASGLAGGISGQASGAFVSGGAQATVITDGNGIAMSPALTANSILGTYYDTASEGQPDASGNLWTSDSQPALFELTNSADPTNETLSSQDLDESGLPANSSTYGDQVSLTATVTSPSGAPAGSVQFESDSTTIPGCSSIELTNGSATCTTSALTASTTAHTIVATYSPTSDFTCSATCTTTLSQTVNPAPLTVTASDVTVNYGSPPSVIPCIYSGFANGDSASSLTSPAVGSTAATSESAVGTYSTACSGASDVNYNISYVDGSMTIGPASLVIYPTEQVVRYGQILPSLSWTAGFAANDGPGSLTTQPECVNDAEESNGFVTSPAGQYSITCSGASDPNYLISYGQGALTVLPGGVQIEYTGPMHAERGKTVRLDAILSATSGTLGEIPGSPVGGRRLHFTIGRGRTLQYCNNRLTTSNGLSSCVIKKIRAEKGNVPVVVRFAGDPMGTEHYYKEGTLTTKINIR